MSAPVQPQEAGSNAEPEHDAALKTSVSKPDPLLARIWAQTEGKVGLILTSAVVLLTVLGYLFAEQITGHSTTEFIGLPFTDTGLFGTDNLGRSVFSRFVAGGLILLVTAFLATLLGMIVGTVIGMIAGYAGGKTDAVLMRVADIQLTFPAILIALLVDGVVGAALPQHVQESAQIYVLIFSIGISYWPQFARTVRGSTLVERGKDYVMAARVIGLSAPRILVTHILPNVLGPVLVNYLREYQLSIGVEKAAAYDITLYILAGLLVLGFICNALVRPVAPKYFMSEAELAAERAHGEKSAPAASELEWSADPSSKPVAVVAWLVVGIPLAWGVWITLQKTVVLFQ